MLKTYELEVTGELPLEFDGEELFTESNAWVNGKEQNRYHKIDIYQAADGGLILYVCFITHWQGENNQQDLWELSSLDEVLDVLGNYDPIKHLVGFPSGSHFKEKQADLQRRLARAWIELKAKAMKSLGIKRVRKAGQPQHPLGQCKNPGWSIPQQIRDAITKAAAEQEMKESEVVVSILSDHLSAYKEKDS